MAPAHVSRAATDAMRALFAYAWFLTKRTRRPAMAGSVSTNRSFPMENRVLLDLHHALAPQYENVHRGQSSASQCATWRFEAAYDDIARFVGAKSRNSIGVVRNTTEAHNAVMYSLLTQFRDGDNVVSTLLEHNSNHVPWPAMCRLSFYLYNTPGEVDRAVDALADIVAGRRRQSRPRSLIEREPT